jgi:hypothetical protein
MASRRAESFHLSNGSTYSFLIEAKSQIEFPTFHVKGKLPLFDLLVVCLFVFRPLRPFPILLCTVGGRLHLLGVLRSVGCFPGVLCYGARVAVLGSCT